MKPISHKKAPGSSAGEAMFPFGYPGVILQLSLRYRKENHPSSSLTVRSQFFSLELTDKVEMFFHFSFRIIDIYIQ